MRRLSRTYDSIPPCPIRQEGGSPYREDEGRKVRNVKDAAIAETGGPEKRIPAFRTWLSLTIALGAAALAALVLVWLQEPVTVFRDGPAPPAPPPSQERRAEAAKLGKETERISRELRAVLRGAEGYQCPPGAAPSDPERFEAIERRLRGTAGPDG